MTLHVSKDVENSINAMVQSGRYASADELITRLVEAEARRLQPRADEPAEATAFDVAMRAGLIGCLKGAPRSPTDLSTNPKHMKGFGRA